MAKFDIKGWLIRENQTLLGRPLPFVKKSPADHPDYPILAASNTWYKGTTSQNTITEINIVNSYTATGNETESWAADVDGTGSIMCYVTGTVLIIAGNGSGKIMANEDSSYMFSEDYYSGDDYENRTFEVVTAISGLDIIDTSKVTDMSNMFSWCHALTSLDLSHFDTSNVTNMHNMFSSCSVLTSLNISTFNTSKVTDMSGMFGGIEVTSLDLSHFDTSNVTNMHNMFWLMSSITSLDLSNFVTSKVTDMSNMFYQLKALTSLNISSFDTSKVADMDYMFCYSKALTVVYVGSGWTTNNASTSSMFAHCGVSEVTRV